MTDSLANKAGSSGSEPVLNRPVHPVGYTPVGGIPGPVAPWELRPAEPRDLQFILQSWLRSYAGSEFARGIRRDVYDRFHHALIERLLARSAVICAVLPDDPGVVLGYAAREGGTLHYVYVKGGFRRMGIGIALAGTAERYTHRTGAGARLATKLNAIYNPYLV